MAAPYPGAALADSKYRSGVIGTGGRAA